MHPPQLSTTTLALGLVLAPLRGVAMLRCENVRVDGHSFDLSQLGGPHSVVTSRYESIPDAHHNTTYTLDICKPLKKSGTVKKTEECPNGTRVCAIQRFLQGDKNVVDNVVAIAGSLENVGGSQFEYEATRLKTSDSNSDSQKEGLRLVLKGGKDPLVGPVGERREQKAIVEFLCDPNKKGDEGEWEAGDKYDRRSPDDNKGNDGKDQSAIEHQLKKEGAALVWEGYGREKDADVLRLTWHTKFACEKRDGGDKDGGGSSSSHWGFFTWFVVLVFLGIAAYLIFGSWLNYNRYGARGWDLLPHGDAIREIPYLMKDWTRRVLNTVQGTGSRGGYSAV
ncbi:Autophagy-like protein 27 [Ophiocordyceps camponoti-floridani]|uniref:Autophagy-related protein 27 n=1 Tax=Ophiocordyceps camponoti-floridani TaxID=2030778 RepID=A0A8H4Q8N2_9HYPO|nr:Autophagy-like protein 27 [Ophiocordyceps camponoti-floridani]